MRLLNAVARIADAQSNRRRRRRSAILAVLVIASAASACTGRRDESRGTDTSTKSTAASPIARSPASAGSQHVVIDVKGMYCASCEQTVVTMLRRTSGVVTAEVSVERGEATVSYDARRTSPADLVQVVKMLGYDASVKRS